jgi:hypothetical protein
MRIVYPKWQGDLSVSALAGQPKVIKKTPTLGTMGRVSRDSGEKEITTGYSNARRDSSAVQFKLMVALALLLNEYLSSSVV